MPLMRHEYIWGICTGGDEKLVFRIEDSAARGRMKIAAETYMSMQAQMIPCVPPASGRVPEGQEGRTIVQVENEGKRFMRTVMDRSFRYRERIESAAVFVG